MRRVFVLIAVSVFLCSISYAQDSQTTATDPPAVAPTLSLGEISRQLKAKKQQKEAQLKSANAETHGSAVDATPEGQPHKAAHLVTNEDDSAPASVTSASVHPSTPATSDSQSGNGDHEARADNWKSQIQAQKSAIASMQQEITALSNSIHYAGGNCIANCAQWNERQEQKQQQVESMRAQLDEQQKHLEEMQESARKEGFGSSVYEP
jgi:hypothetical protein